MKSTRFLLFLFFAVCTFNLSAQSKMPEYQNIVSEGSVIQNLVIDISNPGWDGVMNITLDGQQIYNRGLGGGCLLLKDEAHSHFVATKDVRPGDKLKIWASIVGIGNTNIIELIVPEVMTDNPILVIDGHSVSMDQVTAYFSYY